VNTPFYVESQINIDPYNGCNNSPVLTSLFPLNGAMYNLYTFSLLGSDIDADSISYRLTIPKMDIDEPVKGYWIPGSINDKNDILLSQLYLNNFTGEIIWQYPNDPGLFNFALQVHEWRYLASLKEWINMGFVTYDFNTNILEGDNPGSVILDFKDTALVAGSNLMVNFRVEDTEGDSTRAFILSDIYPKNHLTTSLDENIFYPTPFEGSYRIINTEYLKRTWPYKLVLSTFQKDFHSIESQQSAFVWIVDDEGKPVPPSNPSSFLTFRNKIGIKWDDNSGNEAGYVVERADSFFPEFVRIAALPKNTTEFTDENVIPNRDYYYRIKAIGTGGSAYSEILEVKEPDITTGLEERVTERESILYPNPADNQLWISWDEGKALPESILIFTTDGKTRKKLSPDYYYEENTYRVPVSDLAPGVYIVRIKTKSRTENRKLIIK